jgi:hypothetical protein
MDKVNVGDLILYYDGRVYYILEVRSQDNWNVCVTSFVFRPDGTKKKSYEAFTLTSKNKLWTHQKA